MTQNADNKILLYRARLLVEEGRYEAAGDVLTAIQPENEKQQQDVAYLQGWCYIQRKQWEDALQVLLPILQQTGQQLDLATPQERERQALSLLRLGIAAVNLSHYEDASLHFTLCLKVLHDRRVHLPVVRITARYSLAMTCLMRGLYTTAIQHYEEALRQARYYNDDSEVPHIYHGLCSAYLSSQDLSNAYTVGQEALSMYQARDDQAMAARMHNMLGRVCFLQGNYREASDHYTESLAIATAYNGPMLIMLNCAALADLRLAEERIGEAKRYAQLALTTMERTTNAHMQGRVYHALAKVTYAESQRCTDTAERQVLLEKCVVWYDDARMCLIKTQAYADMADVCNERAQALEELGRAAEAIESWREGYTSLHQAKDMPRY